MERFLRKVTAIGTFRWDVYVDGFVVGTVYPAHPRVGGFYGAHTDRYGERETCRFLGGEAHLAAARWVADCHDSEQREMAAEQASELYAEFGMSYVCGGGLVEDVGAAWAQFGPEVFPA
jgi:2-polyprenyl-6-methoxyphenol hydroxylase-like FAD-dependent oxidoreductase